MTRITPACAGRSKHGVVRPGGGRDHPRVCGEEPCTDLTAFRIAGSPPRVRGGGNAPTGIMSRPRITPACAGRRNCGRDNHGKRKDHPRVCGEEGMRRAAAATSQGSPPRVRGGAGVPYIH